MKFTDKNIDDKNGEIFVCIDGISKCYHNVEHAQKNKTKH